MGSVIIFLGDVVPAWWQAFRVDGYTFITLTQRGGIVPQVVDLQPALILVDGDGDTYWIATPKSNSATRRIPILAIGSSDDALRAGADMCLSPDALSVAAIEPFIREPQPLDCSSPLPDLAREGIEQFNQGKYYKQHDSFEALWMATDAPVRDLYRAILQVGVAYFQITRGNYRGGRKMLLRSVQWLAILPDVCQGVDVKALRDDSSHVRAVLESMQETDTFDMSLLQPVKLVE